MEEKIRILNVEDLATDSELAEREVRKVLPDCEFRRVETREEYLKALDDFKPHLIISDYSMPTFDGLTALKLLLERTSLIPLIILTGSLNEDIAVECMKAGAVDYVLKEYIKRLGNAVLNALEQSRIKAEAEKAQAEAREKQNVIEKIANTVPMEVYIFDLESKTYIYSNHYFVKLLDYSFDTLNSIGPAIPEEFVHPDDRQIILNLAEEYKTLKDEEVLSYEYRVKDKHGNWHWLHAREVISERFENGDPWQVIGVINDNTEKRSAEEQLRRSEIKYRSIFENIQDVYYEVDLNGIILEASPSIAAISKYTRDELIGKNMNMFYAEPSEREAFLRKLHEHKYVKDYEVNLQDKDHTVFPCAITAHLVNDELTKSTKISGIMRDISERKRDEENIKLLSSALESAANAIVITDNDGTILWVNNAFLKLTGFSREEALGANPRIVKSGIQNRAFYKALWDTILQGKVWHGELVNRKKNKELYTEEMTITPVIGKGGKISHFIAIKSDITERKKAEKELVRAKVKAEESDRLKTVFLQNLSHEIRTPMNAIVGFSDLLETNIHNKDKLSYCTSIIKEKSHELLGIINEILDISLIESGQMPISQEEVNINSLLDDLFAFYLEHKQQIDKKNIDLQCIKVPEGQPQIIVTDKTKLTQVFNNLLNNAFKFTDEGVVKFGFQSTDDYNIHFFVSDTGMGIPKEKQAIVFDRFRQADEGSTRKKGGLGLGLSIVKGLLKLLNGNIMLNSEPNKGSSFFFNIPLQIPEQQQSMSEYNEPFVFKGKGKTLLIIEDDFYNLEYLKEALEDMEVKILTARTGREAIEKTKDHSRIDVFLLDIGLPDINGLKLIPEIKNHHPKAVIIAITAYATPADKEKSLQAGCDDYISKPTDINNILETLNKFC
jgi:PAS domain S-box-containing protein